MSETTRTYDWYLRRSPARGHTDKWYVEKDITRKGGNCPSSQDHIDHYEKLGILHEVPTLENFKPLVDMYVAWYRKVGEDWSLFQEEEAKGGLLVTLHWTLSGFLHDPNIDPRILQYLYDNYVDKFAISLVDNPSFPDTLLRELIEGTGKKNPVKDTRGGEMACFILHNKSASSSIVDLCARKTKKAGIQNDAIGHPNVSRETLVFLSKNGKSPTVKRYALEALVKKGLLNVQ